MGVAVSVVTAQTGSFVMREAVFASQTVAARIVGRTDAVEIAVNARPLTLASLEFVWTTVRKPVVPRSADMQARKLSASVAPA